MGIFGIQTDNASVLHHCLFFSLDILSSFLFGMLQALAQQYSSELLQTELERTRINTACFAEAIPLDSVPEPAKSAYASFRGSIDSPSKNYRGSQATGSPSFSRHRRRLNNL